MEYRLFTGHETLMHFAPSGQDTSIWMKSNQAMDVARYALNYNISSFIHDIWRDAVCQ